MRVRKLESCVEHQLGDMRDHVPLDSQELCLHTPGWPTNMLWLRAKELMLFLLLEDLHTESNARGGRDIAFRAAAIYLLRYPVSDPSLMLL